MALADYINSSDFNLLFEDTLDSGVFSGFCGVQNAEWARTSDVNTVAVPNCDPALPSENVHYDRTRNAQFTGSGTVDGPTWKRLEAWWAAKARRNVRLFLNVTGARGGGYWQGLARLMNLTMTAAEHDTIKFSFTVMFDGEPAFTAAA
jgi:hypothetical protein